MTKSLYCEYVIENKNKTSSQLVMEKICFCKTYIEEKFAYVKTPKTCYRQIDGLALFPYGLAFFSVF